MSYQYPTGLQAPPAGSSLPPPQSGFVDAAGYRIDPAQAPLGMGGYPVQQGFAPAAGGAAYPPMPPGGAGMGYPPDPYSAASATGAYPPPAGSSLPPGGSSAFGYPTNDLYSHAQQYGLTRGEVDAALQTYQEMNNMDRSVLSSLGSGSLQKFLGRIFGGSSGTGGSSTGINDQFMSNLSRILSGTLSSGRLPNIKEFLTLLGTNKMQYGPGQGGQGGKYGGLGAMGTGMGQQQYTPGGAPGMGGQQPYQQGGMGLGMGGAQQQQYPQQQQAGGMGMGMGQQYPAY